MTLEKVKIHEEKLSLTKMADGYFYAERYSKHARRWIFVCRRRNIPDLMNALDREAEKRMKKRGHIKFVQYIWWSCIAGTEFTAQEKRDRKEFLKSRYFIKEVGK